jgi:hypothetical protein
MQHAAVTMTQPVNTPRSNAGAVRFQYDEEETLLNVDLSGLELPKVNNLHVDGLQRSWFSRLFGSSK